MRKFILLLTILVGLMRADDQSIRGSGDHKILGGTRVTDMRKVPYIVSLAIIGYEYGQCGGTIITPLWVVTACHCVAEEDQKKKGQHIIASLSKRAPLDRWTWIAGTPHLNNVDHAHVQYGKPAIVMHHPQCKISTVHGYTFNDLGLVKMKKPFKITEYVKPAKLFSLNKRQFQAQLRRFLETARPGAHQPPRCIVAGWGRYQAESLAEAFYKTPSPITTHPPLIEDRDQLKSSVQKLLPAESCAVVLEQAIKNEVPDWFRIPDDVRAWREGFRRKANNQICIHSQFKNESACQGDSGGGVVCGEYLVGVNSWSYGCIGSAPTILQNLVNNVFGWFKKNICDIRTCEDVDSRHKNCVVPKRLRMLCKNRVTTFRPPPKQLSSSSDLHPRNTIDLWLIVMMVSVAQNILLHTYTHVLDLMGM